MVGIKATNPELSAKLPYDPLTIILKIRENFQEIQRTSVSAGNYMFKINNRNTRTRCEICSNITIKTPVQRQWRRCSAIIVNCEHISHLVLVFLLLTLSR